MKSYMAKDRQILDSNIFIALYFKSDTLHQDAIELMKSLNDCEIFVPYCVIQEVTTILTYRLGKKTADNFIDDISNANNCFLIDNNIYEEMIFFRKTNKKLSFTDLSLIFLAKKYKASLITFDKQLRNFNKKTA